MQSSSCKVTAIERSFRLDLNDEMQMEWVVTDDIRSGVGTDGIRQILGVSEGEKEDLEGWRSFLWQRCAADDSDRGRLVHPQDPIPRFKYPLPAARCVGQPLMKRERECAEISAESEPTRFIRAADFESAWGCPKWLVRLVF